MIRASFSLRNFTVPYQYFWNNATNYGGFYYQFYTATARISSAPGSFTPGSVSLGNPYPPFLLNPTAVRKGRSRVQVYVQQQSDHQWHKRDGLQHLAALHDERGTSGFSANSANREPWKSATAGNRTIHQWLSLNVNEVNVFENGFLQEFKNAQKNLAINVANGTNSFGNLNPGVGTVAVPILTAAFTGDRNGSQTASDFRGGTFITQLNTGAVGSMAQTLTTLPYFCSVVGAAFSPCVSNAGYTGAGGGYPINFFQANPYASGIPATVMTDPGWSNYHSMQVEFRQRFYHGLQFNANYTWSHNLGVASPNDWTGAYTNYTLRSLKESYGPTNYDLRHVFNVSGTADLPFGAGRKWAQGGPLNKIVGGWTVGTIMTYRSGAAGRLTGNYSTFNNVGDGGVILKGVTREELQNAVGVYKSSANFVQTIDPKYRTTGVGANTNYIVANTTPGIFAGTFYIYGPGGFECDMSLTKDTAITERDENPIPGAVPERLQSPDIPERAQRQRPFEWLGDNH